MPYDSFDIYADIEDYRKVSGEESQKSPMSKEKTELWNKALAVAHKAHEGQMRDEGTPYINHVLRVANCTRSEIWGDYGESAIIALLHDTIEDSDITHAELQKTFGDEVADGVQALSKTKGADMTEYLQNILRYKNKALATIKLLDRIDNIQSLANCPNPAKVEKYLAETENIFIPLYKQEPVNEQRAYLLAELSESIREIKRGEK